MEDQIRKEMDLAERKVRANRLAELIEQHSTRMLELAKELREEIRHNESGK